MHTESKGTSLGKAVICVNKESGQSAHWKHAVWRDGEKEVSVAAEKGNLWDKGKISKEVTSSLQENLQLKVGLNS